MIVGASKNERWRSDQSLPWGVVLHPRDLARSPAAPARSFNPSQPPGAIARQPVGDGALGNAMDAHNEADGLVTDHNRLHNITALLVA